MLRRKYIFESKHQQKRSFKFKLFLFSIIGILFFYITLTLYLPFYAKNKNSLTNEYYFKKTPDAIFVYTGDSGRLDKAFQMAQKYPASQIFISGVYAKNSLKTLLTKQGKDISVDNFLEQEKHHITLDYLARNTVENVLASLNYLRKRHAYKDIIIISSDYHIFRISLIVNSLLGDAHYQFFYNGIEVDYTKWANIKKLFKETFKILKATTFLLFWERENF